MKAKLYSVLKSILSYFIFIFIVFGVDSALEAYTEKLGGVLCSVIFLIFLPMILNSLVRLFFASKSELEEFMLNKPDEFKKGKQIAYIAKSFGYLSSLAVCLLFLIAFPSDVFSLHISRLLPLQNGSLLEKAITVLVVFALFAIVSIFARLSVREKWFYRVSVYQKKLFGYILSILKYIFMYTYCALMLMVIVDKIKTVFFATGVYKTDLFDFLIWATVLFLVIKYVRVLLKRRKFIKNLKKSCFSNKFKLSKINRPYLSLFKNCDDANFTVEAHGKKYACRLLSGKGRGVGMILFDDGEGVYKYMLKLKGTEVYTNYQQFTYGYESEFVKCVVITSMPAKVMRGEGEKIANLFTGEKIGEYYYFEPQAFINSLERDCMERRQ